MPHRALIVDDSAFIRRTVERILIKEPDFEVVATAPDGRQALRALEEHTVDVVVLDVEMPEMDGLETLVEIRRRNRHLPVVMFSTLTTRGSEATMTALTEGASDYAAKPSQQKDREDAIRAVRDELVPKLRSLAETYAQTRRRIATPLGLETPKPAATPRPAAAPQIASANPASASTGPDAAGRAPRTRKAVGIVAIGVSTGGPNALQKVIGDLPGDLDVPVVITQHMPPVFTELLAQRLDGLSSLRVKEAESGDLVLPNHVYLAPGDFHMRLVTEGAKVRVALDQGEPINSCRPAVDAMLDSLWPIYGERTLIAILTGMGSDGLESSRKFAAHGAPILAQDAATSVVWGMPGYVAREGVADQVLPLDRIGPEIATITRTSRSALGHPA